MICIHCGNICDWLETNTCPYCQKEIDTENDLKRLRALLLKAYNKTVDIKLMEQIEIVLKIE